MARWVRRYANAAHRWNPVILPTTPGAKPSAASRGRPIDPRSRSPVRRFWYLQGARVQGPLELLIRHAVRAQQAVKYGRPMLRLDQTPEEEAQPQVTVIDHRTGISPTISRSLSRTRMPGR